MTRPFAGFIGRSSLIGLLALSGASVTAGSFESPVADPAPASEAVVQVWGARTRGAKGIFGVHTWVAVKPEKAAAHDDDQAFIQLGIRPEVLPMLQKMGIHTVSQLREMKPGKLLNDLGGIRKKLKLDQVTPVTLPEIEGWLK